MKVKEDDSEDDFDLKIESVGNDGNYINFERDKGFQKFVHFFELHSLDYYKVPNNMLP